ncbi:MAG: hypothetical protein OEW75_07440 [Cyclobacteriaceae bacterium]|nr:hypothetical protein [Cyclobacteriaceae bacterium]
MPRDKSDSLFKLIHSLTKNEKRYFKIYIQRGGQEDTKTIKLFDAISSQEEFDENKVLSENPELKPDQLSNLKAELYKHLLESLRLYHDGKIVDLKIRQHIDYAQLLTDRCLYEQSHNQLKKGKKIATQHDNLELLLEIIRLEKSIMPQLIDNKNQMRVNKIVAEVSHLNEKINRVNQLSNLESKLNSLYKKVGFIRDQRDHNAIENYLNKNLPKYKEEELSDLEKIHLYNLFIGYFFFIQNFHKSYENAIKLVSLFEENPRLIISKTDFYIQALNKLSIAQSKLSMYDDFVVTIDRIQKIPQVHGINLSTDLKTRLYKYYYMHQLNRFMLIGDFKSGIEMIQNVENGIESFIQHLDQHSSIIFYYKIACMYFGDADYNQTIQWLNKIINLQDVDIRRDIHCFARILNLVAHYEVGNLDVIDYYIRSTYRFLAKKYDLRLYQQYILKFLKNLGMSRSNAELNSLFKQLRSQLLTLRDKPYEKRAFIYFDIISWLESKMENRKIGEIIREKAMQRISSRQSLEI